MAALLGRGQGEMLGSSIVDIEDDATLELLDALGVDMAQGFRLGRPAPLSAA